MFEKTIDYARGSLAAASESAIEKAGDKLGEVVKIGVSQAGDEMREVVAGASKAIDEKLDKISQELHSQRQFTKDDVRELVDYAGDKLSVVLDQRIEVMRQQITQLDELGTDFFLDGLHSIGKAGNGEDREIRCFECERHKRTPGNKGIDSKNTAGSKAEMPSPVHM